MNYTHENDLDTSTHAAYALAEMMRYWGVNIQPTEIEADFEREQFICVAQSPVSDPGESFPSRLNYPLLFRQHHLNHLFSAYGNPEGHLSVQYLSAVIDGDGGYVPESPTGGYEGISAEVTRIKLPGTFAAVAEGLARYSREHGLNPETIVAPQAFIDHVTTIKAIEDLPEPPPPPRTPLLQAGPKRYHPKARPDARSPGDPGAGFGI